MAGVYHKHRPLSLGQRRSSCYTSSMISRDVLYYTLAAAAAVATVFWVWLLWYIIKIFKTVEHLVEDFRDRLRTIDEILQTIHDKLTSTHAQLSMLSEGVKQLVSFFIARRSKSKRSSARASSTQDDF